MRLFLTLLVLLLVSGGVLADGYPRRVVDLAGRSVELSARPQRILLQDSNDLLLLAILAGREAPTLVVGWNNSLAGSDPSLWRVLKDTWPDLAQIPAVNFSSAGEIAIERLLRLRPDLVVARLEARPAVESGPLGRLLAHLRIPLLYVDSERDPLHNVPASLRLLGDALDRSAAAQAYLDVYERRRDLLLDEARTLPARRVFVEIRAGETGAGCCRTQGAGGWGQLVTALGAHNLGSQWLRGVAGDVALERLIRQRADVYIMTGTQRRRQGKSSLPLGYDTTPPLLAAASHLLDRPGLAQALPATGCASGIYHQFYNSAFNVAGLEYLAKALWPQELAHLDPAVTYQTLAGFAGLAERPRQLVAEFCRQPK